MGRSSGKQENDDWRHEVADASVAPEVSVSAHKESRGESACEESRGESACEEGREKSVCKEGCAEMGLLSNLVLHVLSDERVQDMIRRIVSGERVSAPAVRPEAQASADGRALKERERQIVQLETQVTRLQGELAQTKDRLSRAQGDAQALERERAAQATQLQGELARTKAQVTRLERELKQTQDKLSRIQGDATAFKEVYAQYCALPKALKDNLKGYFCDQDVWTFLISGSQPDRIRDFWDYCRNDLARGRLPAAQREALLQIFNFFFDRINRSLGSEPQWRLQCVKPGESFDSAAHSATSDSASVGRVASVVWPGFLYATNNKVCRKSLVVVQ